MSEDIFLIDTNILIYGYDQTYLKKHEICVELLDKCWKEKVKYAISIQNLSEFYFVIITKFKNIISEKDAEYIIRDIIRLPNWKIINFNENTILSAIEISQKYKMSYWDSLLAATMKENSVLNIYTENEKDFKVPWLNIVNPFKKKR